MAFPSSPQLGHIIALKEIDVNVNAWTRIRTTCAHYSSAQETLVQRMGLGGDVLLRVMRQNPGPAFLPKLKTQVWLLHEFE
jgi:hypothetical protein